MNRYERIKAVLAGKETDKIAKTFMPLPWTSMQLKTEIFSIRSGSLGLTMDIFPTLCEITGIAIENRIDGINLCQSLTGRNQDTDSRSVWFMRREGCKYGGLCYYAARKGACKLVQNTAFEKFQLF